MEPESEKPEELLAEETMEAIAVDRTRLMRGLTPDGPTPPYQSAFSGGSAQRTLEALLTFYARNSYSLSSDVHEAPDYLGVELAFAATLCKKLAALSDEGANEEEIQAAENSLNEFITTFVGPLALAYSEILETHANTHYHRQFAWVLREFTHNEQKYANTII